MDKETILKTFGNNVREQRLLNKVSQEELAFNANLDRTYIGGVERGERNVSLHNISKIAKALNIEISTLLKNINL
ncbi:MAG: helix-turn-helix transcriptional regulator [Rikenellaceae bacterium]